MGHDDQTWWRRAACRGTDGELFFPEPSDGDYQQRLAAAKAICRVCPVRGECRTWAVTHSNELGVWGGLTDRERRALRRHGGNAA
ncbi:MAG: WhiB family transcriptional regulator [Actinomycetota bacterium]|nr:WhiB family transcriptional regulator [Actinomycetota bacterium]